MIQWHSELNPLIGALVLLSMAWAFHGWRRQLMLKISPAMTLGLLAPRLLIAALLVYELAQGGLSGGHAVQKPNPSADGVPVGPEQLAFAF